MVVLAVQDEDLLIGELTIGVLMETGGLGGASGVSVSASLDVSTSPSVIVSVCVSVGLSGGVHLEVLEELTVGCEETVGFSVGCWLGM